MAQNVTRRPYIAEAEIRSEEIPYWFSDGQSNVVRGPCSIISDFRWEYRTTSAPYLAVTEVK